MTIFKNENINKILILSIFLFSIKWILSFYFFNESLSVRIIFESVGDGHYWYPVVKFFASFEFNNSLDPYIKNLKLIHLPFTSLIFHTIFFKIFNFAGIIIIEFFAIFTFLFIFYGIFSYFFSKDESIFLSLLFFVIPGIIKVVNFENLTYLNLLQNEFFSFRAHRPVVSSLYFFSFIYLLVLMDNTTIFEKKNLLLLD